MHTMGENFILKWNDHSTSFLTATSALFTSDDLTDVTLGTTDRTFREIKVCIELNNYRDVLCVREGVTHFIYM